MPFVRTHHRGRVFRDVLGFVFSHWRRQPARIAAVGALALLAALTEVLIPIFAGRLVDNVARGAPADAAVWRAALHALGLLLALGLVGTVLRQAMYRNIIHLTLKIMTGIAADAFHRLQRFSSDWHANSFAGSTVRMVTRGMWAVDLLNDTMLLSLLPSVVMLSAATLVLGVRWPLMGVVLGGCALVFIAVTVALSLFYVAPAARLGNAWDTRLGGALADAVTCNAVVKAFGAETREEARLNRIIDKWRQRTRLSWSRATLNGGVQGAMLLVLQAAMLGGCLLLWTRHQASAGDVTFALTMYFMLRGYLRDVGMHVRNLQRSVNDMEELVALSRRPLGVEDAPDAPALAVSRGEIRFEHVQFRYNAAPASQAPLFDDFNLHIAPGERIGLVGRSGSGKTTFIKLIQRLHDLGNGRITIDAQDIARVQQASLRRQIAIVQQEPILFHRTLGENIAYGRPGASQHEIEHAATLASAHGFIAALPQGYDTLVGERGVKLSGGERQRIAIARAFLADAPILILDEATSSLDSESEVLIQQAMERLMVGRTTIVVAHRLSTVRSLDRLLVMANGRVVEQGSHDALVQRPGGIYRRLFERQALHLGDQTPAAATAQARDQARPRT